MLHTLYNMSQRKLQIPWRIYLQIYLQTMCFSISLNKVLYYLIFSNVNVNVSTLLHISKCWPSENYTNFLESLSKQLQFKEFHLVPGKSNLFLTNSKNRIQIVHSRKRSSYLSPNEQVILVSTSPLLHNQGPGFYGF